MPCVDGDHIWSAEWRELDGVKVIVVECEECGKEELLDARRMYD